MKRLIFITLLLFGIILLLDAQDAVVLGIQGQEGELANPRDIREGPDGNIYVYDEVDAFIKVYSPQGKFLRKMGGEGQGPGEIQRRDGVSFGFTPNGKLFFTEYFRGHRWITFMELTGELTGVLKIEIAESFGIAEAVSLPDGGFLAEVHLLGEPEKQKDYFLYKSPIKLLRLDAEGKVVAEIKKTEYHTRISYRPDGADSPLPFTPTFCWCFLKNQAVLFSDGLSNKLEAYDLSGKPLEGIQTLVPEPEKVREKDLDRWREERKQVIKQRDPGWYYRSGSVIEKYTKSIFRAKPILEAGNGLSATPEGNILVSGVWDNEKNSRNYWLLEESGKILAQLSTDIGRITLSENFIFFVTSDEEMNIRVGCLKRKGKERDDLPKLPHVSALRS